MKVPGVLEQVPKIFMGVPQSLRGAPHLPCLVFVIKKSLNM